MMFQDLVQGTSQSGTRVYTDSAGLEYISCTSLLSLYEDKTGLNAWVKKLGIEASNRERDLAAQRGTIAHKYVEDYLESTDKPTTLLGVDCKFARNAITGFYQYVSPIEMEQLVAFNDGQVRFAGRFDQLVHVPENTFISSVLGGYVASGRYLVDLKTKKLSKPIKQEYIFKHLLQLSAYIVAKEIMSGELIDGAMLVFSYPRSSKLLWLPRNRVDYYWGAFHALMKDYFDVEKLTSTWKQMVLRSEYLWDGYILDFCSNAPVEIRYTG